MEIFLLLTFIVLLLICLIASVIFVLYYVGILGEIKVSVGKPVISNITMAYKVHNGPYKDCGPHFTEAYALCPDLPCVGIYYDNPKVVPKEKWRYIVGLVLSKGEDKPSDDLVTLVKDHGFQITELPEIDYAVKAQYPFIMNICAMIGAWRVYPALEAYVMKHKLSAHPYLELYMDDKIHYMGPLSKQSDFFVPEVEYTVNKAPSGSTSIKTTNISGDDKEDESSDEASQATTSSFEELTAE